MSGGFDACLALVLVSEGGFSDDPADPGGATKFGISARALSGLRGHPVTRDEIAALTEADAGAIYRHAYWDALQGDALPVGVAYAVFDAAVNSGVRQAALWLQAALGVEADGVIGPKTCAAARSADPARLIGAVCDARLAALSRLATFSKFGRGWTNRVGRVWRDALAMTGPSAPEDPKTPERIPSMDTTQSLFASRTVWSNVIGFAAFILSLTGRDTGGFDAGHLTDSVMQLVTAGSFIASTVFRIISTKKVAL